MSVQQIAAELVRSLEAHELIGGPSTIEEMHVVDDRGGLGCWIVTYQVRVSITGKLYDDVYHVSPNGVVEWTSLDENTKEQDAREAVGIFRE